MRQVNYGLDDTLGHPDLGADDSDEDESDVADIDEAYSSDAESDDDDLDAVLATEGEAQLRRRILPTAPPLPVNLVPMVPRNGAPLLRRCPAPFSKAAWIYVACKELVLDFKGFIHLPIEPCTYTEEDM